MIVGKSRLDRSVGEWNVSCSKQGKSYAQGVRAGIICRRGGHATFGSLAGDKAADEKTEALWQEAQSLLAPAGINRQMFGVLNLWLEGQFHLGNCNEYLKADDVAFYRTWWEDTILPTTDVGRYFLKMGTEMYNDGLKEGRRNRPSLELCQRTADSWMADMRVQNSAK